jgi:hypothetical protein
MTTTNEISPCDITEGNLRATKDTSTFGGPNMWRLHIQAKDRYWEEVSWISYYKIQKFFNAKLPYYNEIEKKSKPKYELT